VAQHRVEHDVSHERLFGYPLRTRAASRRDFGSMISCYGEVLHGLRPTYRESPAMSASTHRKPGAALRMPRSSSRLDIACCRGYEFNMSVGVPGRSERGLRASSVHRDIGRKSSARMICVHASQSMLLCLVPLMLACCCSRASDRLGRPSDSAPHAPAAPAVVTSAEALPNDAAASQLDAADAAAAAGGVVVPVTEATADAAYDAREWGSCAMQWMRSPTL
jgi:hypothetical protein